MFFRLLIDLVVVGHFAFIVFVAGGGLLTWRWPRAAWIHVPMCIWGIAISLFQFHCPLTPLEKGLRRRLEQTPYEGGFIEHYLTPLVYPRGLPPDFFVYLGVVLLAVNVFVYGKTVRDYGRTED